MVQYRVRIKKVTTVYRDFLVDTKSKKELRQKLNDILYDGIEMVPEIHQCIDNHLSSEKCGVYNTAFEIEQIGKNYGKPEPFEEKDVDMQRILDNYDVLEQLMCEKYGDLIEKVHNCDKEV